MTNDEPLSPTNNGLGYLQRWHSAIERDKQAKSEAGKADCEKTNSANELGKWLFPKKADTSSVTLAVGNSFLVVTRKGEQYSQTYSVAWLDNRPPKGWPEEFGGFHR